LPLIWGKSNGKQLIGGEIVGGKKKRENGASDNIKWAKFI
jgi:hypothetical protein